MLADRDNPTRTQKADRIGVIPRLLFSRVEIWVVLLLLLVGCVLAIGFGAAVLDAERQKDRLGRLSKAVLAVAEIPLTAKACCTRDTRFRVWSSNRYKSKPTGWSFPSGPMTATGRLYIAKSLRWNREAPKAENWCRCPPCVPFIAGR